MGHSTKLRLVVCAVALIVTMPQLASARNFSCRIGTEPACLDYGDTVCSSQGMCVDRNASCFDSYQCNYEGFTCKSNVTNCVEEHDDLARRFNDLLSENEDLVRRFNNLLSENEELVRKHNDLVDDYEELRGAAETLQRQNQNFRDCVSYASTLNEAQNCSGY